MTQVLADTDTLADWLRARRERGQDRYDYFDKGRYVVAPAPRGEHNRLIGMVSLVLGPAATAKGLWWMPGGVNIGRDGDDYRIPDLAVLDPRTELTSPAFYATALLVAEVLSAGEAPGSKMGFYAAWGVDDYLEIDPARRAVALWVRSGTKGWSRAERFTVLDLTVAEIVAAIDWP